MFSFVVQQVNSVFNIHQDLLSVRIILKRVWFLRAYFAGKFCHSNFMANFKANTRSSRFWGNEITVELEWLLMGVRRWTKSRFLHTMGWLSWSSTVTRATASAKNLSAGKNHVWRFFGCQEFHFLAITSARAPPKLKSHSAAKKWNIIKFSSGLMPSV